MAKKTDKEKSTLTSMQAVTYSREFRQADRAGGFTEKKSRR
ncbi:YfhE family protein [Peribacillus sp. NPDC097295]